MWPGRPSSAPGWAERGCRVEPAPPTPPTWRIPSLPWRAGGDRVQGNSTLGFVSTRQKCRAAAARASQPGGEEAALVRSLCFWGGGRDFCPRHRELPRAPVPQSPRDQQALRPALPMTSSGCVALTLNPPGPDSTTGPGVWVHLQDTLLRVRTPSTGPPGSSSRAPWGIPVRSWSRVPRALVFTNARPQATPHVVTCPSKL